MTLTFGSLFSGIGGIDLGLERAGMRCAWQCEIDDYAQKVLSKHWPSVPRFRDVRNCGAHNLAHVDLICGGFPCQDVSTLGSRVGITGIRSGLWAEYARIVRELRPRYVFVENVPDLLRRGGQDVYAGLAAMGYDAEWFCFPASAVGAHHKRERLAIVAYATRQRMEEATRENGQSAAQRSLSGRLDTFRKGRTEWLAESPIRGMAHGVPDWVDRLKCLGNAVVPAWAEFIGQQIAEFDAQIV